MLQNKDVLQWTGKNQQEMIGFLDVGMMVKGAPPPIAGYKFLLNGEIVSPGDWVIKDDGDFRVAKCGELENMDLLSSYKKNFPEQPWAKTEDPVNSPSHYTMGHIEVIEAIESWQLNYHRGNAVKYLARAGRKNPLKEIEDLDKAVWYINREIKRLLNVCKAPSDQKQEAS